MSFYLTNLKQLSIIRGVYHYFRFTTSSVDAQIENIKALNLDFSEIGMLPLVVDIEYQGGASNLTDEQIKKKPNFYANKLLDFLLKIEVITGRKPIIYTNKDYWNNVLKKPTGFENYLLWVADYGVKAKPTLPSGWNNSLIWQYTETGFIEGISMPLDKNIFNGTLKELEILANIQND